ncbi:unnamed protein product [Candidula unifasciata]|uniref:Uncharacterized protein n=1 Tax=Candidula unifasciata TaxID=100452 RepID=A0A8S3Z1T3_9EUPU|nr:unnamed protein product [Candidula unifasciata]
MATDRLTESSLRQHHILHPVLQSVSVRSNSQSKEDHDSNKSLSRVLSRSDLRKSFPLGSQDSVHQLHRQFSKSSLGTTLPRSGLSFFRVIQAARTWKRLSLRKEGVVEKPKCMFENTYQLGPDPEQIFKPEKVEEAIHETLGLFLKHFKYTPEGSKRMCLNISSELKSRVKGMNFNRYKIVTQVVILQNRKQGSNISSRCVWTPETDSFASCTFKTEHIICVANVYAVYFE